MEPSIPWVDATTPLPDAQMVKTPVPGLLAAGLDLSVSRLEEAYSRGIFPWFNPGEPVLWWSPDPRAVLFCDELHISHSLAKRLRQISAAQQAGDFQRAVVTVDCAFEDVMQACASRNGDNPQATWITPEMKQVYQQWHQLGRVHSVETWLDGDLVGGLYGVSLGQMFFGESMFSRRTDASKIALVHLVRHLQTKGVRMIDCQMTTSHLTSLGAREIDRADFISLVYHATQKPPLMWQRGWINPKGHLDTRLPDFLAPK